MKQLSSVLILSVNGSERISYTYDTIDAETGELIDANTKENFFAIDETLRGHIEAIRDYIRTHKLGQ